MIRVRSASHTFLIVKVLDEVEYDRDGEGWKTNAIQNPSWEQIETAIQQLDQSRTPIIRLRLREDVTDKGYLSVVGGNGVYAMEGRALGHYVHHYYYDEDKSAKRITIRVGNEEYHPEEKFFCCNIGVVLKVAEYFARLGHFAPDVTWAPCDPFPPLGDMEDPWRARYEHWRVLASIWQALAQQS